MFVYPNFKVTRANLAPLIPERLLKFIDPSAFLAKLEGELTRAIRHNIRQEVFSPEAKRRLYNGFKVERGQRSLTIIATDPAFRPLIEGQRRQQMTWLTKAATPIPIITDTGELIFRNASPKSMERGAWIHPGRKPTRVIEKAKATARDVLKQHAAELMRILFRKSR